MADIATLRERVRSAQAHLDRALQDYAKAKGARLEMLHAEAEAAADELARARAALAAEAEREVLYG